MPHFQIEIDAEAVHTRLDRLLERAQDATPAMQDIARALRNLTEDAFQTQGSPFGDAWQDLTEGTRKRRARAGHWPGPILQSGASASLATSISSLAGRDFAQVGAAKLYAAIHQFGGLPGMAPGPAAIPARPYLPVDDEGNLPDSAAEEIRAILSGYLTG